MEGLLGILIGIFIGWLSSEKLNTAFNLLLEALHKRAISVMVLPDHARVDRELKEGQPYVEIAFVCRYCHRRELFRFTEPPRVASNCYQCPHCQKINPVDPELGKSIAEALSPQRPE